MIDDDDLNDDVSDLFRLMDAPIAPRPTAQEMADEGMSRAADHAESVNPGWNEQAFSMLLTYAETHFEFMTEDVRVWAHTKGLPQPPDGRAWGAVTQRAVRARLLVRDRYRKTRIPPAHATPRPVWRSPLLRWE
jgi:CBS domain-containing protein